MAAWPAKPLLRFVLGVALVLTGMPWTAFGTVPAGERPAYSYDAPAASLASVRNAQFDRLRAYDHIPQLPRLRTAVLSPRLAAKAGSRQLPAGVQIRSAMRSRALSTSSDATSSTL